MLGSLLALTLWQMGTLVFVLRRADFARQLPQRSIGFLLIEGGFAHVFFGLFQLALSFSSAVHASVACYFALCRRCGMAFVLVGPPSSATIPCGNLLG